MLAIGMVVMAAVVNEAQGLGGLGGHLPGEGRDGGGVTAGKMMSKIELLMHMKVLT